MFTIEESELLSRMLRVLMWALCALLIGGLYLLTRYRVF